MLHVLALLIAGARFTFPIPAFILDGASMYHPIHNADSASVVRKLLSILLKCVCDYVYTCPKLE